MKRGTTLKHRDADALILERHMVTHHDKIEWDMELCVGCQIGPLACPKEAISHIGGEIENGRLVSKLIVDVDPDKCIFCGICTVMCPMNAITMWLNDEKFVPVLEYEAFPKLVKSITVSEEGFDCRRDEFVLNNCPTNVISCVVPSDTDGDDEEQGAPRSYPVVDEEHCIYCRQCEVASDGAFHVEQPWQGTIELRREKCVEGCLACADICPTRALYINDDNELVLADYYCIKCGACMEVCPIKPEVEEYTVTFESQGLIHTRTHERIINSPDLPIWVERWRIRHEPVHSAAWLTALVRLADEKAEAVEIDRTRALKRRDLLMALVGTPPEIEVETHKRPELIKALKGGEEILDKE